MDRKEPKMAGQSQWCDTVVPDLFGTREQFVEDSFPMDAVEEEG